MSKNKFGKPHNAFVGSLEHHGGKKLSQQGANFFIRFTKLGSAQRRAFEVRSKQLADRIVS